MPRESSVLIVGGGPTGLALACQLLRRGVGCRVVEKAPGPLPISRAIGLSPRSLEVLDECGVADLLVSRGIPTPVAAFYSRDVCIGRLTASSQTDTRFPFMLAVPQWETERILAQRVVELGGDVDRSTELTEIQSDQSRGRVIATVCGPTGAEVVEPSWAIAADGAHSAVRKELGIGFPGRATSVVFVIVDAEVDQGPPAGEGHYYFSPDGLLVVIPLPDGSHRLAATLETESREEVTDTRTLQALVDRRVGSRHIKLHALRDAGWGVAQVRIHARIAECFRSERVFLAGDAAHIYSPVGGQGLNGGLQDAHNLAWKLALVVHGHAPSNLLDSYGPERENAARMALKASARQTRLATIRRPLGIATRDALVSRASKRGLLDRRMAPQIAQFDIDYRGSPIIAKTGRRSVVGRRIPNYPLAGPLRTTCTVYELLDRASMLVLALAPGPENIDRLYTLMSTIHTRYRKVVSVHTVLRGATEWPSTAWHVLRDVDDALVTYCGGQPSLCVIRPDGHIGSLSGIDDHAKALETLANMVNVAGHAPAVQGLSGSANGASARRDLAGTG
jgi:3-(3-hydroxy-phenyl)propionate hydroxylase